MVFEDRASVVALLTARGEQIGRRQLRVQAAAMSQAPKEDPALYLYRRGLMQLMAGVAEPVNAQGHAAANLDAVCFGVNAL